MTTWLLLDAPYLVYRAHFAMGHLSHGDVVTGAVYGFLRDSIHLQDELGSNRLAFCFDRGDNLRCDLSPEYKANRRIHYESMSAEERRVKKSLRRQLSDLRKRHLRTIGYRNVFSQRGYEADDIIASICKFSLGDEDRAVIVSADKDFYQLLNSKVSVYHPQTRKTMTEAVFRAYYGIDPALWVDVKAIAGCDGDNVKGLRGVGDLTAAKFLAHKLKPESKAYKKITHEGSDVWQFNLPLVQLPFRGVDHFTLRNDRLSRTGWRTVAEELGIRHLPTPIRVSSTRKN